MGEHVDFITRCITGDADPADIEDEIEEWHTKDAQGKLLHEFLGMTVEEYNLCLNNYLYVNRIIESRVKEGLAILKGIDFNTKKKPKLTLIQGGKA